MPEEPPLEAQAVSKVVEILLSSQLEEAQAVDVEVNTDLGKMAQGKVNSILISSKEPVTLQNLSVQELEIRTEEVSINPLSALLGKLELNQPVDSVSRVVIAEDDINRLLSSGYFGDREIVLHLTVNGQNLPLKIQPPITVELPGDSRIRVSGNMQVFDSGQDQQVQFQGSLRPRTNEHSVLLEEFAFGVGQALSLDLLAALVEKLKHLIDSPYLTIDGMT
ncbi:MAG TPA: DUF2993 domain-containing protein, partial [Trichocoleus sp.]